MIDIEKILTKIGDKVDKKWWYLKPTFASANSEYEEQFGDSLSDDKKAMMSLMKVGAKYNLDKATIEELIGETPETETYTEKQKQTIKELGGNLYTTDDPNHGEDKPKKGDSAWKRFLDTIPDPVKPKIEYEKTPSMIVEIGPTYYLKLTDPKTPPYSHEFDGKYGTYIKHAFKVTLVKVSDEDLYDVKYKNGDFAGEPAFVNGNNYTLWLDDKAAGYFSMFWDKLTEDGIPDGRVFTFKHGKKANYNIWTFGEPKK